MPARRLRPNIHTEKIQPVRMWRDDVDEIVTLLKEAAPNGKIDIRVDDYELDDIEDMAQIPASEVASIKISGRTTGKIEVRLTRYESLVSATDPDLKTRGLLTEIGKITARCRRPKLIALMGNWKFWGLLSVSFFCVSIAGRLINYAKGVENQPFFTYPMLAFAAVATALAIVAMKVLRVGQSIFFTQTRAEAPTFWIRKRDDLTITIASNLASLILGGAIGYWINTIS